LRLFLVLAGEDHPKVCTGRRLLRWRRVVRVPREGVSWPSPIVLDPYAPTPLSGVDRPEAARGGLLAVDCSWNRLHARGAFPGTPPGLRASGYHRRLPLLIATNPQHYGRVAQLNTVEALSAAVYILGRVTEAEGLLEGFRGGEEFLKVNRDRLERYRTAPSPAEVSAAERVLFGGT
jgi:pre-rRNA-processing protein TSR3